MLKVANAEKCLSARSKINGSSEKAIYDKDMTVQMTGHGDTRYIVCLVPFNHPIIQ